MTVELAARVGRLLMIPVAITAAGDGRPGSRNSPLPKCSRVTLTSVIGPIRHICSPLAPPSGPLVYALYRRGAFPPKVGARPAPTDLAPTDPPGRPRPSPVRSQPMDARPPQRTRVVRRRDRRRRARISRTKRMCSRRCSLSASTRPPAGSARVPAVGPPTDSAGPGCSGGSTLSSRTAIRSPAGRTRRAADRIVPEPVATIAVLLPKSPSPDRGCGSAFEPSDCLEPLRLRVIRRAPDDFRFLSEAGASTRLAGVGETDVTGGAAVARHRRDLELFQDGSAPTQKRLKIAKR